MRIKTITEQDIKDIIDKYTNKSVGIESLCAQYGVGKLKIKDILAKNDVPIKKKGAQIKHNNTRVIIENKPIQYGSIDKDMVAVCKKTGVRYNDVNNLSGTLTSHILKEYSNIKIPPNTYQRKKYELEFGKKWFDEYFEIVEIDKKQILKCPYCDWSTTDVENKSGAFTKHIFEAHGKSISDLLLDAPELSNLYKTYFDVLQLQDSLNDNNSVICLECGESFLGITNKHLAFAHNMSMDDYKVKWGEDAAIYSKETINFFRENAICTNQNMTHIFASKAQVEISEFIKSLGFDIKLSDKKTLNGKEIDILVLSKNIGFEYNGLLWHSEKYGKHKRYHIDKTIYASKNGVKLYQIFEDEWIYKKEIVCERIRHILGVNKSQIYARKCEIREIDSSTASDYLNKTHIQGSNNSNIRYGAFYNNKLVAVMTFSKLRKVTGNYNNSNDVYELNRFSNSNVVGIASKLLKHFIKTHKPKKILSYADRRWTPIAENTLYDKLGFELVGESQPNYWYMKNYKSREHRFNYRKDILVKKGFDSNKTEGEIMKSIGYDKIWDCGSFRYELIVD